MNRRGFLAALLSAPIAYAAVPEVLKALVPPAPIVPRLVAQIYNTSPLMRALLRQARENEAPKKLTYQGVPITFDYHEVDL